MLFCWQINKQAEPTFGNISNYMKTSISETPFWLNRSHFHYLWLGWVDCMGSYRRTQIVAQF